MLIDALVAGDAEEVGRVLEDRLHEPYRVKKIKRQKKLRAAAREAGAVAVFISGSGPTLAALCASEDAARRVLEAMLATAQGASFQARGLIAAPDPEGARVAELD